MLRAGIEPASCICVVVARHISSHQRTLTIVADPQMQTTITDAGDSSVITGTGLEPVNHGTKNRCLTNLATP